MRKLRALSRLLLILLFVSISISGCSRPYTGSQGEESLGVVTEVTVTPSKVRGGDDFSVEIIVHNYSDSDIQFGFKSMTQFAFSVNQDQEVILYGPHMSGMALSRLVIRRGDSASQLFRVSLSNPEAANNVGWKTSSKSLPPGVYTVTGGLAGYDLEYEWGSVELVVTR